MENMIRKGLFTLTALAVLSLCAVSYAGQGHGRGMQPPGPGGRGFGPPDAHLLDKAINENMAAEALAEITGKTLDVINAEVAAARMHEVVANNSIDAETFKTAMNAKMSAAAQKAADCGLITAEQAAEIIAKIAASASDTETDASAEETVTETISETVKSAF